MEKFIERLRLKKLWTLVLLSLIADSFCCNYLAMTNHCKVSEIYEVVGVWWLSPIFGLFDLIIGLLILYKALQNYHEFLNGNNCTTIKIPLTAKSHFLVENADKLIFKLNLYGGVFISAVSIASLILDVRLFFHL